jgi:hypothetical protein
MFTKGPTISVMDRGALALMLGGVNFYPSCRQIRIGSSQTGTPNQSILFLGTYDDSDPERLRFGRVHIKATSICPAPPLAPPKIGAPSISSQLIDSSSLSDICHRAAPTPDGGG